MSNFGVSRGSGGGPQLPQVKPETLIKLGVAGAFVIVILWGLFSCLYRVEADSEAVVLRFGKYLKTADPGLHYKLPFGIDRAYVVPVKRVQTMEFGFRTVRAGKQTVYGRGTKEEAATSEMLTGDLNIANVEWTVQYQIKNAKAYLFHVANVEETIRDVSEAVMRTLVGDRSVDEVITMGREEVRAKALIETQNALDGFKCGVKLRSVNLQEVTVPDAVKNAFNKVNTARQKKDQIINQARGTRNSKVPAAGGKAKKTILEAQAYKKRKILEVTGEMSAFLKRYEVYKQAERETRVRLYMETMEKILSQCRKKVFLDESVKGILPHLDLGAREGGAR